MKPILFNGEMVRAILEGRKNQTRRVVKPQPKVLAPNTFAQNGYLMFYPDHKTKWERVNIDWVNVWATGPESLCPYGQPGGGLWVRETWDARFTYSGSSYAKETPKQFRTRDNCLGICYRATCKHPIPHSWMPSIFMPRWASRITLEITDVRVERVQEISALDTREDYYPENIDDFSSLWDSINLKRGFGWDTNPYVWAISFKRSQAC